MKKKTLKMLKKIISFNLAMLLSIPLLTTTAFADERITTGGVKDGLRVSTSKTNDVFSQAAPKGEGKWYCEIKVNSASDYWKLGVSNTTQKGYESIYYYFNANQWRRQPTPPAVSWEHINGFAGFSVQQNDIIGLAIDGINNKLDFYKNGTILMSNSFKNFDLNSNNFSPYVATGDSGSVYRGSYDVSFALDSSDLKYPVPEGYVPYGNENQSPDPTPNSKIKVVMEPEEELHLSVDDHLDENNNMTWTSSDNNVAQVDANGVVTAIKAGNAVIHVQSRDGIYSEDMNILVVDNADDYRLAVDLTVGETSRLTVDDLANTLNITWESSDASVSTVSSKGVVTAKGKGLTLAKAKDKDGNVVGQIYIRVR